MMQSYGKNVFYKGSLDWSKTTPAKENTTLQIIGGAAGNLI